MGYYDCVTPSVILRNVSRTPAGTPYTPYQAEIAQGRLESLLNFQTMVSDLTGMDIATASLLDEGTGGGRGDDDVPSACRRRRRRPAERVPRRPSAASADARRAARRAPSRSASARGRRSSDRCRTPFDSAFGLLCSTRTIDGASCDLRPIIERAHAAACSSRSPTDLLALTLLTPPGEMGADVVVGNSQRFGVPLGYGGPHAAFFATREAFVRQAPGRIIGVSVDARGRRPTAWRCRRASSTSAARRRRRTSARRRRCSPTSPAMYAVYHGPDGLRAIAERVHDLARALERALTRSATAANNAAYFDTLCDRGATPRRSRGGRAPRGINFRYLRPTADRHRARRDDRRSTTSRDIVVCRVRGASGDAGFDRRARVRR